MKERKSLGKPARRRVPPATASVVVRRGRRPAPIYLDDPGSADSSVETIPRKGRGRIVFGWYGGKFNHLGWLLPLLPECRHYCEPFGGSAAVLLNRPPSSVETYNDLDGEAVNFFRVLREDPEGLKRALALTPFSREELFRAVNGSIEPDAPPLERARRFYIRARQARTGLAQTATLGRWANCKATSRNGMSGAVSRWLGGVEALAEIAERLLRVQIENRPALDLIRLYDDAGTLFYCDPPYLHGSRGDSKAYEFEMTEADHIALAEALGSCLGMAAVSGYRSALMDEIYRGWKRHDAPTKMCHSIKKPRRESVWTNF